MKQKQILCKTSEETQALGEKLGRAVEDCLSIALTGDLGCGKTTLVQGMARGLGVGPDYYITSPTFTLINEYPAGKFRLCHLDLYRLGSTEELAYIGFDDLLGRDAVVVVEWPDLLRSDGFSFDLELNFKFTADFYRDISVLASGQAGEKVFRMLFS